MLKRQSWSRLLVLLLLAFPWIAPIETPTGGRSLLSAAAVRTLLAHSSPLPEASEAATEDRPAHFVSASPLATWQIVADVGQGKYYVGVYTAEGFVGEAYRLQVSFPAP
jgi:hypothetical protein